jgi:signal transduction histidine kinase
MGTRELGIVRHDLKNVLSAISLGCTLIERRLRPDCDPEVREFLEEMQAELHKGSAALERLRELDRVQPDPGT